MGFRIFYDWYEHRMVYQNPPRMKNSGGQNFDGPDATSDQDSGETWTVNGHICTQEEQEASHREYRGRSFADNLDKNWKR